MVLEDDRPVRMKHRFSAKRMLEAINLLNATQKEFLHKYNLEQLLGIKSFQVPVPLIEWIIQYFIVDGSKFRHRDKTIKFTRAIVKDVIGIPSGSVPVNLDTRDVDITSKANILKELYIVDGKSPISVTRRVMLASNDEETFIRSFMLFALSTIFCPSTQNFVNLKYLNCLTDLSCLNEFDWAGHILDYISAEVKKFQIQIDRHDGLSAFPAIYVGSCLPLLAIVYMDFLDIDPNGIDHHISYALPRICNVSTDDFNFVMNIDRKRQDLPFYVYGARPFRDISSTPYLVESTGDISVSNAIHCEQGALDENAPGCSSSSLNAGTARSIPNNMHSRINAIVAKHLNSFKNDLAHVVLPAFVNSFLPVFSNHVSRISSEIYADCLLNHPNISPPHSVPVGQHSTVQLDNSVHSPALTVPAFGTECPAGEGGTAANAVVATPGISVAHSTHSVVQGDIDANAVVGTPATLVPTPNSSTSIVRSVGAIGNVNPDIHMSALGSRVCTPARIDHPLEENILAVVSSGINIAMSLGLQGLGNDQMSQQDTGSVLNAANKKEGSSTIEKKKRKKRHAICLDEVPKAKISMNSRIEDFYHKFICSEFIRSNRLTMNSPIFVDICGLQLSYADFRACMQTNGHISLDFMNIYVKIFNNESLGVTDSKLSRYKISFSPVLVSKLSLEPVDFDPDSTEAEFTRLNSDLDLRRADLFFLPCLVHDRWVLVCINMLFSVVNFFDPLGVLGNSEKFKFIAHVVTNFQRSLFNAQIVDWNLECCKRVFPICPRAISENDSGIYVLLCKEFWNGKELASFSTKEVVKFRKVVVYKTISSPLNCLDPSAVRNAFKEDNLL